MKEKFETNYLRNIRIRIKEKFNESLSPNTIAILIWEMLENNKPITYQSIMDELTK